MSDYLSHLAAAAVRPHGDVRPRLPGRFAPSRLAVADGIEARALTGSDRAGTPGAGQQPAWPSATGSRPGGLTAAVEGGVARAGREAAHSPGPSGKDSHASAGDGAPEAVAPRLARPAGTPAVPVTTPKPRPAAVPPPAATPVRAEPAAPPLAPGAPAIPAAGRERLHPADALPPGEPSPAPPRPSTISPPPIERTTANVPTAASGGNPGVRAPLSTAAGPAPRQIEPAEPSARDITPAVLEADRVPAEPILGPPPSRRSAIEPMRAEPVEETAPSRATAGQAPTIRVTIGRIEVRAMVLPAPPARQQPPRWQPALPLDEYLRRRNGGAR